VKADANTGLASPDVFYFGSLAGDALNDPAAPTVNAADLARTRANIGRTSPWALGTYDFNHDGRVDALDVAIVRGNQRRTLSSFTAPAAVAPAAVASFVGPGRSPARPARRGVLDLLEAQS
jgi:hypothetical protein